MSGENTTESDDVVIAKRLPWCRIIFTPWGVFFTAAIVLSMGTLLIVWLVLHSLHQAHSLPPRIWLRDSRLFAPGCLPVQGVPVEETEVEKLVIVRNGLAMRGLSIDYPHAENRRAKFVPEFGYGEKELNLALTAFRAYAELIHRDRGLQHECEMRERGGTRCWTCSTLFVPSPNKPWTQNGYCSKSCLSKSEGTRQSQTAQESVDQLDSNTSVNRIELSCSQDHHFRVSKMYRGTLRSCPDCGEKVMAE